MAKALSSRTGAVWYTGASSVQNQMFTIGSATGVQFHPEVTEEIIHDWCKSTGRKQREEIISQTSRNITESNQICRSIIHRFSCGVRCMNVKGVLLDLDGVLYTGDNPIPGAPGAVRYLKEQGYIHPVYLELHQEKPGCN